MEMILLELLIFVLGLIFLYYKLSQRPDGLPPGDWGYPILGNLPRSKQDYTEIIQAHFKKYGEIFSVKMGSQIYVFLADFQLIKNAFSKSEFSGRPKKFSNSLQRFTSEYGLVWSESHIWETNRKFTMKTLSELGGGKSNFEPIIRTVINTLLQELSLLEGESVSIEWSLNASVLNVMFLILTGKSYQSDDNELIEIWAKMKSNLQILEGENLKSLDNFPWVTRLLPNSMKNKHMHVDELKENVDFLRHFLENIIEEHKKSFDKNSIRDYIDEYLLDIEDVNNDLEEDNFKKEMINLTLSLMDLIVDGTYNTASTLQWFLLYMISYPNVQEKIHKEIDNVINSYQKPSQEDRQRLPYLEATLCEVNRIASLVPYGYPHEAMKDMELGGFKIPKGTCLVSCSELCHMNPVYFENPNEFLPERFLDSVGKLTTKEGYLPFSIGCRSCLGESLANLELFMFSSSILQKFKVTTSDGDTLDLTPDVSSTVANVPKPFKIIFHKRNAHERSTKLHVNSLGPITEVEPEIISGLLNFKPQILSQGFQLEPQDAISATRYNVSETEFEPLVQKTITKVQSQNISHSHEFEPQTLSKGTGTESSTKTHSTEIKSEVNSELTGEGSQVRQRVIVRKSQVQSKVTVVKSQTTSSSSNWSKISNVFDSPDVQQGDFSEILNNFDGNLDQFLNPEGQKAVFKSMSSNVDSHFE